MVSDYITDLPFKEITDMLTRSPIYKVLHNFNKIDQYNTKIEKLIIENNTFLNELKELVKFNKQNTNEYKSIKNKQGRNTLLIEQYQKIITDYTEKLREIPQKP